MPLTNIPTSKPDDHNAINYGLKKVFWGPGQLTAYPSVYMEPVGWRDQALLQVPLVFRGFEGGAAISPPPPPPPIPSANSLCIPGSHNGYTLIGYRFGQNLIYRNGGSSQPCGFHPALYSYSYLYALNVKDGSFTSGGVSTDALTLLGGMISIGGQSKASWQSLMNKDYIGEDGIETASYSATPFCPAYTFHQAKIIANSGTDLGPAQATYNDFPDNTPWRNNNSLIYDIKYATHSAQFNNEGQFTVYFFIDCVGGPGSTGAVCSAILPGWNPTPDQSQLSGCGRETPAY